MGGGRHYSYFLPSCFAFMMFILQCDVGYPVGATNDGVVGPEQNFCYVDQLGVNFSLGGKRASSATTVAWTSFIPPASSLSLAHIPPTPPPLSLSLLSKDNPRGGLRNIYFSLKASKQANTMEFIPPASSFSLSLLSKEKSIRVVGTRKRRTRRRRNYLFHFRKGGGGRQTNQSPFVSLPRIILNFSEPQ